jgi:hypothetical protein
LVGIKWRIHSIDCSGTFGNCSLLLEKNIIDCSSETVSLHSCLFEGDTLVRPYSLDSGAIQPSEGLGLPWHLKTWTNAWHKLQDLGIKPM